MNQTSYRMRVVLAVAAPIFVMLSWWSYYAAAVFGVSAVFPIEGYDPRDLLSGHYLRYQVNYGMSPQCDHSAGPKCMCLEIGPDRVAKGASFQDCAAVPDSCRIRIKGACSGNRFLAGIERFYFSEKLSKPLATVPKNSSILVKLRPDGGAVVADLLIEGRTYREVLAEQGQPQP